MHKTIKFLFLLIFYFPASSLSQASDVKNMNLIGTGSAYYLGFIKVYDAALYSDTNSPGADILRQDASKCLKLTYAVEVEKEDFITAANTTLQKQFTESELKQVSTQIGKLHKGYQTVQEGDFYTLCYSSDTGITSLALNNLEVVSINSPDFAAIYFSIWLGNNAPLDNNLRKNLLAELL